MTESEQQLKVLVAYNQPNASGGADDQDYLSEAGVKDEANAVYESLQRLNHFVQYLPLNNFSADLQAIKKFRL